MNSRVLKGKSTFITQPFHYEGEKGYSYYHGGIDLVRLLPSGGTALDWIVAHSDGVVVDVRMNCMGYEAQSYGNYVLLKHSNGYYTMYAHLAYGYVKVVLGQSVKKGEVLGYMDNTGDSQGGHLHWEVRTSDGTKIDPEPYLNKDLPGIPTPSKKGKLKKINGEWCYVVDGKIDTTYNGFAKNKYGWWKITKGKVDFSYNGLAKGKKGWYLVQSGKKDDSYNGLCPNANGTWVLKKGKVDFSYNGKYKFSGKSYTIQDGKVAK